MRKGSLLVSESTQHVSTKSLSTSADSIGATLPPDNVQNDAQASLEIIQKASKIGEEVLGPAAELSDQMECPNRNNFRALAEAGLLGLSLPRLYGGLNASEAAGIGERLSRCKANSRSYRAKANRHAATVKRAYTYSKPLETRIGSPSHKVA